MTPGVSTGRPRFKCSTIAWKLPRTAPRSTRATVGLTLSPTRHPREDSDEWECGDGRYFDDDGISTATGDGRATGGGGRGRKDPFPKPGGRSPPPPMSPPT